MIKNVRKVTTCPDLKHYTNVLLNVMDLIIMEAISIYLEKSVLCKQKEFDYKVPLFG